MSPALRALAVLALAATAGCFVRPRSPDPSPALGEWAEARDGATRPGQLYDGLQHRANAIATHLTPQVREARARRLAAWLGWTAQELAERLGQERAEAAAAEEFVVAFYTADPLVNDLDAPQSIWRIAVKVEGADLLARKVDALEPDATLRQLFPYAGPFDTVYRVRFPRPAAGELAGRPFVLQLASALGKLDLDFGLPAPKAIRPFEPAPPPSR